MSFPTMDTITFQSILNYNASASTIAHNALWNFNVLSYTNNTSMSPVALALVPQFYWLCHQQSPWRSAPDWMNATRTVVANSVSNGMRQYLPGVSLFYDTAIVLLLIRMQCDAAGMSAFNSTQIATMETAFRTRSVSAFNSAQYLSFPFQGYVQGTVLDTICAWLSGIYFRNSTMYDKANNALKSFTQSYYSLGAMSGAFGTNNDSPQFHYLAVNDCYMMWYLTGYQMFGDMVTKSTWFYNTMFHPIGFNLEAISGTNAHNWLNPYFTLVSGGAPLYHYLMNNDAWNNFFAKLYLNDTLLSNNNNNNGVNIAFQTSGISLIYPMVLNDSTIDNLMNSYTYTRDNADQLFPLNFSASDPNIAGFRMRDVNSEVVITIRDVALALSYWNGNSYRTEKGLRSVLGVMTVTRDDQNGWNVKNALDSVTIAYLDVNRNSAVAADLGTLFNSYYRTLMAFISGSYCVFHPTAGTAAITGAIMKPNIGNNAVNNAPFVGTQIWATNQGGSASGVLTFRAVAAASVGDVRFFVCLTSGYTNVGYARNITNLVVNGNSYTFNYGETSVYVNLFSSPFPLYYQIDAYKAYSSDSVAKSRCLSIGLLPSISMSTTTQRINSTRSFTIGQELVFQMSFSPSADIPIPTNTFKYYPNGLMFLNSTNILILYHQGVTTDIFDVPRDFAAACVVPYCTWMSSINKKANYQPLTQVSIVPFEHISIVISSNATVAASLAWMEIGALFSLPVPTIPSIVNPMLSSLITTSVVMGLVIAFAIMGGAVYSRLFRAKSAAASGSSSHQKAPFSKDVNATMEGGANSMVSGQNHPITSNSQAAAY